METRSIDLRGQIPTCGEIEFVLAEFARAATGPLVIIRYAERGEEQPLGLRFDLDKGVFLDHFDDNPAKEQILTDSAQIVGSRLADILNGGEGHHSPRSAL